ncbi:MAG: hypothetical protein QOF60_1958 [Actinomycetota bacterium]|jgi:glycosyltransferase involved in cell wall biosynthesis|nr:hypothetical protein [Actinomycetota bacterium]
MKLVAYSDSDVRGGAEQTLKTLLGHLDAGIDVVVLGPHADVLEWIAEGRPGATTEVVAKARSKADVGAIAAHVSAVRRLAPDILHVNLGTPWHGAFAQLAGLLRRGTRVVAVEHTPLASSSRLQVFNKRQLSSRIDAHVACGAWLGAQIERIVGRPPGSVRVIHNGVPETLPPPTDELPKGRVIVGAVGRLTPEKGFDDLLRAAAGVPDIAVVIVGTGPDGERLASLGQSLGIADRLTLTGWVLDSREYLCAYDVLALPSHVEGFPLVTLEALLAGIPVIASDVGGVSEAVRHDDTGLLIQPRDVDGLRAALLRTVGDLPAARALAARGQRLVREQFVAPVMARKFEALYEELIRR